MFSKRKSSKVIVQGLTEECQEPLIANSDKDLRGCFESSIFSPKRVDITFEQTNDSLTNIRPARDVSHLPKGNLVEAFVKLKPYFTISSNNWKRSCGIGINLLAAPGASVLLPLFLLEKVEKDYKNDLLSILVATAISTMVNLSQDAVNTMLTLSTSMDISKDNILKLMQESQFLVHGNTKDITSLQYVTVGRAVSEFTNNAIPVLIGIPTNIATSIATFSYIYYSTGSIYSVLAISAFVGTSVVLTSYLGHSYAKYAKSNLEIVNKLVGTVNNIEAYKDSITSMGALKAEAKYATEQIQVMANTIPKLTVISSLYTFLVYTSPIISNNFLGYYYTDTVKPLDLVSKTTINILIMSLVNNAQKMALALTAHYPFIEVNLKELLSLDQSYKNALESCESYKKQIKIEFKGESLAFKNLSIFVGDKSDNQKIILDNITLALKPNKIYKLSADSGSGKTLFLNTIIQNWSYAKGELVLPSNSKGKICFIPKDTFIPPKTLLEVLIYPSTLQEYTQKFQERSDEPTTIKNKLIANIKELMIEFNLWNQQDHTESIQTSKISLDELEDSNIDWNTRLSGGERQRVGIIRALLTNSCCIIMDEATNAIDLTNKIKVFNKIKDSLLSIPNWNLIYTEHDTNTDIFADYTLHMTGQKMYIKEDYVPCSGESET